MRTELRESGMNFIQESYETPIVVDFWAEWCSPCRMLSPVLEKLANDARGQWRLLKINVDENPEISQQFNVRSIPTVKMIYEGKVIGEFMGAQPEYQIQKWLEQHLPTEEKKLLESAKRAIANGEIELAKGIFKEIIKSEPENDEARVLYGVLLFETDLKKAADVVKPVPEESPFFNQAEAILTLARLRFQPEALKAKAQAEPEAKAAWETYLAGAEAFAKKNYAKALESWIDVMIVNRELDDDGARRACVALFTLLGHDHELTRKYHRKFSMALY